MGNQWVVHTEKVGKVTLTSHLLRCSTAMPPADALKSLWLKVCEAFPLSQPAKSWNSILFSVRPDSGRLIAFPGLNGKFILNRRITIWIALPDLERQYYSLPDVENNAADFDRLHTRLVTRQLKQLITAGKSPAVKAALSTLRQSHDVDAYTLEYDDLETIAKAAL